jgi:hypothetical protein
MQSALKVSGEELDHTKANARSGYAIDAGQSMLSEATISKRWPYNTRQRISSAGGSFSLCCAVALSASVKCSNSLMQASMTTAETAYSAMMTLAFMHDRQLNGLVEPYPAAHLPHTLPVYAAEHCNPM